MSFVLAALLDLLCPPHCPACHVLMPAPTGLCPACSFSLYPLGNACPVCARPEDVPTPSVCARCRRVPPPFASVSAPFRYGGELATAIKRFKFGGGRGRGRPELARPLAALLCDELGRAARGVDLIVPVPLSRQRLRARGFSQAHRLAQALVASQKKPELALHALARIVDTREQARLSRAERQENVAHAFAVTRAGRTLVAQRRILLVDDVVTTGATVASCARTLLAAGAYRVDVLALARAEN